MIMRWFRDIFNPEMVSLMKLRRHASKRDDIQNGEYEVVSQDPDEGEQVHTSDTIHLVCKDVQKIRVEEMEMTKEELDRF